MQPIMVFNQDRAVLSVNVMQVVLQTCSVMMLVVCAHVRTAPLGQNVTCVVKTSSISHQRDASEYACFANNP